MQRSDEVGGPYAKYVLVVLTLVYVFNFVDRQLLSILAEAMKADLGLDDAQIGFLYGTAFAVFYAVFGIALGRLADLWVRKSLIAIGLALWSVMTALSGTARSLAVLAGYRFGVGIGEASATPAAFSMLSDYFSPRVRATVLAIYSSGIFIGSGIGLFLGGTVVEVWGNAYPDASLAPFGLRPWQAAFVLVGLPGLVLAAVVATLREPRRGMSDGIDTPRHPHPFRATASEFLSLCPPFALIRLARDGARSAVRLNLTVAALIAATALGLFLWLGSPSQWIALGVGAYVAFSWVQNLKQRDPATHRMIFGCPTIVCVLIAFPCFEFVGYGLGFWGVPFMLRVHDVAPGELGRTVGVLAAVGGFIGVVGGGALSDLLKRRNPIAGLYVALCVPVATALVNVWFLFTKSLFVAYATSFASNIAGALYLGIAAGIVNDLVLPRMRATASAFYLLAITFVGLALGPYVIGRVSDHLATLGYTPGEALRYAQLLALSILVVSVGFIVVAMSHLKRDRAAMLERARAAGEAV